MNFSICPHDTEKGLKFWKDFIRQLEEKLGEKIDFKPYKSFEEEKENLDTKIHHVYYASPEIAIHLYQKGYKPVARFKRQRDTFLIIGKDESVFNKRFIKVATALSNPPVYGLLNSDFEDLEVIFTKTWQEVFELVKEGKVDLGIIYNETWEEIKNKEGINIFRSNTLETSHIFMVHPTVYDKVKLVLLSFDFLEEVTDDDINKTMETFAKFRILAKKWEEHDIAKAVLNTDNLGIVIYQEKVVFVNDYVPKLFGYSKDEILSKSILDFIYQEDREKVIPIVEKRLKGEKFQISHKEVRAVSKSGKILILTVFGGTILFNGKYSGFLIFFDITKQKKYERLYHLLREVNQAITLSITEEEMFEKVSKALVEKVGLKFVWIGTKESEDNPYFKVIYKYGEDKGYLEQVKISWREDLPTGRGPTGTAFRTDKIFIIPNTQTDTRFIPWREYAKERGFLSTLALPLKSEDGKVKYVITIYSPEPEFFDEDVISVLEELKQDLEFSIKRLSEIRKNIIISKAIENSDSWVLVADENFKITYVNDTVCKISGYSKEELIGQNPRIFKSGVQPREFYEELYKTILSGKPFSAVFANKKKNGELFHLKTTIYPVEIPPNIKRYLAIGIDITKEVELQHQVAKLENYDTLTNLMNLKGFFLILSERLKSLDCCGILALIDIKDFTFINQIYGFVVGNFLLKEVAGRLNLAFSDAIIARTAADEFGIFKEIKKGTETIELNQFIEKLNTVFSHSIFYEDKLINLSFNAGIALAPKDGNNLELLYQNASTSLAHSKLQGENAVIVFNKEIEDKVKSISFAKQLIERALNEKLFTLYYQPFFNTKTLNLEGFEALVRIKDKDGKIYTPNVFIDVLENSKYLMDYEKWLLNEIIQKSSKWNIPISFNISANSFKNKDYIKYLSSLNSKINLIMEITERVLMINPEETKEILYKIKKDTALKIAADDFGIEYSSLKYLKDFPIDEIKIDISFTREIVEDLKTRAVVKGIITLAKELGMQTLAEGVETNQQLKILRDLGCDYVQGYLLGKPMPEEEAEKLIKNQG
ncbi:EAL domain-containing protein [Sulfurihydrogenibium subterraneum]|uniref:EAL domain-containing protein n=1 Tax=Sulfurihydrogenibium subterraneum TaxID=171121 RepID=UPI000685228D|nr:EAL domain-containing protein [Sulfurihydrogenibium subterraneum]